MVGTNMAARAVEALTAVAYMVPSLYAHGLRTSDPLPHRRFGAHEMVAVRARVDEIMQAARCSPVHQVAVQRASNVHPCAWTANPAISTLCPEAELRMGL